MPDLLTQIGRHLPQPVRRWRLIQRAATVVRRTLAYAAFLRDFRAFRALARRHDQRLPLRWRDRFPCLDDRTPTTAFEPHYTYHPAWACRILAQTRPQLHIDVASSLIFVGCLSAFVPVHFLDYRPADLRLSGLATRRGDLLALPFADRSVESISCLHVVEHVGLGRYGDPLDPDGDRKAMAELQRVVAPGGSLLFVTPVGRPRIEFNAHRIYAFEQVVAGFPELKLQESALAPDAGGEGGLIPNPSPQLVNRQRYGCGCFWFRRPA
jgi:SAM-dependent methyltransferase